MKKKLILLVVSALVFWAVAAAELTVRVEGVLEFEGMVMVGLFDTEKAFKDRDMFKRMKVEPADDVICTFTDIPEGEYMVAVYHDVNSNEELDAHFYGKPKEPYGFSNNKFGMFGAPPKFEKAAVLVKDQTEILITLR